MDIIFLRDLKVDAVIGIYDWERRVKQTLVLDLELAIDARKPAQTDSIEHTLDYKHIAKRVAEYVGSCQYHLVETLAEHLAAMLLSEFHTPWVRVRITKPGAVRNARDVGVLIERHAP